MDSNLIKVLTKCLIDTIYALENVENEQIEDIIVFIEEQIASDLLQLSNEEKSLFIGALLENSKSYSGKSKDFFINFPNLIGLNE